MEENNNLVKQKLNPKLKKKFEVILFILTPVIFLGLMILVLNYTTDIWYYLKPKPIIFTLFLLELIHVFLTTITGNSKRSTIIQAVVIWILELINKLRYVYTYEPITFSDFVYGGNFGEIVSIVKDSILKTIWEILPVFCFLGVIFAFLIFIISKFNVKANRNFRVCGSLISLIILFVLFIPSKTVKTFMLNNIFDKDKAKDYGHNSSNMQYYSEYSMLRWNVC